MAMINLDHITMRIAGRTLLEQASVSVPTGGKIGLVGANGTGKTTLFKAIVGQQPIENGSIHLPKNCRIGQVAQEAPGTDEDLLTIVLAADLERSQLLERAEHATDANEIAEIQMRLADIDAHSANARAATILAGLGFDDETQKRPAKSFSGGWRMRVALAAVLFSRPDLLLLDEPTNYLDLEGTLWLENYVARYAGTVVMISHDRDLLDRAVNTIVHLEARKLHLYQGNYSSFERQRAEKRELAEKSRAKVAAKAKHMQAFVDRFRYKASKAKQAQSRLKAIEKLAVPEELAAEGTLPIIFPQPEQKLSSPILRLESVNGGYEAAPDILRDLSLNIDADDRIALLGANGNGKSTFAKLLMDKLPQISGNVVRASKLKTAMFAQHQLDDLSIGETPVDHMRRLMPAAGEANVRSRVAQMGLNVERMDTKVEHLSGGEKARLLLGLVTFNKPDLLILDEPTNHLDVQAREALANALNLYSGAVLLISHDRHLIEATVDRLWIVRDNSVHAYDGDMETYRKLVIGGAKSGKGRPNQGAKETPVQRTQQRQDRAQRRESFTPLKNTILEKEKQIQKLNEFISKIDSELVKPEIFTNDPERGARLSKKRAEAERLLNETEEAWLTLSSEYEKGVK